MWIKKRANINTPAAGHVAPIVDFSALWICFRCYGTWARITTSTCRGHCLQQKRARSRGMIFHTYRCWRTPMLPLGIYGHGPSIRTATMRREARHATRFAGDDTRARRLAAMIDESLLLRDTRSGWPRAAPFNSPQNFALNDSLLVTTSLIHYAHQRRIETVSALRDTPPMRVNENCRAACRLAPASVTSRSR